MDSTIDPSLSPDDVLATAALYGQNSARSSSEQQKNANNGIELIEPVFESEHIELPGNVRSNLIVCFQASFIPWEKGYKPLELPFDAETSPCEKVYTYLCY